MHPMYWVGQNLTLPVPWISESFIEMKINSQGFKSENFDHFDQKVWYSGLNTSTILTKRFDILNR